MLSRTMRLIRPIVRQQLRTSFVSSLRSMYPLVLQRNSFVINTRSFSKRAHPPLPAELTNFATYFKSLKVDALPEKLNQLATKLLFRGIQINVQEMDLEKADVLLQILAVDVNPLSNKFLTTILKWNLEELIAFYKIYSNFKSRCDGVMLFDSFIKQIIKQALNAKNPLLFFNLINAMADVKSEYYQMWKVWNKLEENEHLLEKVQTGKVLQTIVKLLFLMDEQYHEQIVKDEVLAKKIINIIESDYQKPHIDFQKILINHIENAADVKRLADMISYDNYRTIFNVVGALKKDDVWFEFVDQYKNDDTMRDDLKSLVIKNPELVLPAFNLVKRLPHLEKDIFFCFIQYPHLAKNIFHVCKTILSGNTLTISLEEFKLVRDKAKEVGAPTSNALAIVNNLDVGSFNVTGMIKAGFFKVTRIAPADSDSEKVEKEKYTI